MFGQRRKGIPVRLIIAVVIAAGSLLSYYSKRADNPITGQTQHIDMTHEQEIALGLQAAPEMARQFGGLSNDAAGRARVEAMGQKLVANSSAQQMPYQYEFFLLDDAKTINAFALPGGPIFITEGLYNQLSTDGQLAGVLGHEMGHVAGRHSAQQVAKARLTQGLTGAAVLASYDPDRPGSMRNAQMAMVIGQLVNLKHGRGDELQADDLGVRFMSEAGYDPRALIEVMKILANAGGGGRQPEFFSTHPNPENRVERIEAAIKQRYPEGVPEGLQK